MSDNNMNGLNDLFLAPLLNKILDTRSRRLIYSVVIETETTDSPKRHKKIDMTEFHSGSS